MLGVKVAKQEMVDWTYILRDNCNVLKRFKVPILDGTIGSAIS